jgi:hypothetical protein
MRRMASHEENGLHMAVMLRCPSSAHKQGIGRTKVIRTPAACVADSSESAGDAPKCASWDCTGESQWASRWCRMRRAPQSHAGTGYRVGTGTKLAIAMDYGKRTEDGCNRGCVDRLPEQLGTKLSTRAERRKFNFLPPRVKTVSLASDL